MSNWDAVADARTNTATDTRADFTANNRRNTRANTKTDANADGIAHAKANHGSDTVPNTTTRNAFADICTHGASDWVADPGTNANTHASIDTRADDRVNCGWVHNYFKAFVRTSRAKSLEFKCRWECNYRSSW